MADRSAINEIVYGSASFYYYTYRDQEYARTHVPTPVDSSANLLLLFISNFLCFFFLYVVKYSLIK